MLKHAGTLAVLALAILVIAQPSLPVQPAYATSDSMSPAIERGDVYIIIASGNIEPGDIITYYSPKDGDHTTHRVIDRTDNGFLTKGDNNPSTDQAAGYDPVTQDAIVGKVLEVGGEPLTLGGLSSPIKLIESNRLILIGFAAIVLLGPELWQLASGRERQPDRDIVRMSDVFRPLFMGMLVLGTLLVYLGASSHELLWVASTQVTAAHVVPVGEAVTRTVQVKTFTPPMTTLIVEAEGITVVDQAVKGSTIELETRIPAIDSTGPFRSHVHVYPYPATLPEGLIKQLHNVHSVLAILGTVFPVYLVIGIVYSFVADNRMPIRSPRNRQIRRLIQRLGGN